MGKKSAPAAPDYAGAAKAQAEGNQKLVAEQTLANRPNVSTPWGEQTWSKADDGTWSTNISLTPEQKAALDSQLQVQTGRSEAAAGMLDRVKDQYADPMDYSGLPARSGQLTGGEGIQRSVGPDGENWMQKGQDAAWASQKPMLDQRRADRETALANQGLAPGSEAWNREMQRLDSEEVAARNESFGAGQSAAESAARQDIARGTFTNAAQEQGFGQDLRAFSFNNTNRQDALGEELQRRNQPLNETNALLTGAQVTSPQMPNYTTAGVAQAPNQMGALQAQYEAALNGSNAKNAGNAGMWGGLFSLGSAALGSGLFGG